jgi:anhydro-N-acetylmuramic acid kinase
VNQTTMLASDTQAIADHLKQVMMTHYQLSAETIAAGVQATIGATPTQLFMSGGGMHNPALVTTLQKLLPQCNFRKTDELGIPGDAKEAVLFAILANEAVAGGTTSFGNRHKVPSVSMGKISWPS